MKGAVFFHVATSTGEPWECEWQPGGLVMPPCGPQFFSKLRLACG